MPFSLSKKEEWNAEEFWAVGLELRESFSVDRGFDVSRGIHARVRGAHEVGVVPRVELRSLAWVTCVGRYLK